MIEKEPVKKRYRPDLLRYKLFSFWLGPLPHPHYFEDIFVAYLLALEGEELLHKPLSLDRFAIYLASAYVNETLKSTSEAPRCRNVFDMATSPYCLRPVFWFHW